MEQITLQQQNGRLAGMLREARDQIIMLRLEVDRLSGPPTEVVVALTEPDGSEVDVWRGGRKFRVDASQLPGAPESVLGREVVLSEQLAAIGLGEHGDTGEVVTLLELLEGGRRGIVAARGDGERVVLLAAPVRMARPCPGDKLMLSPGSDVAVEVLPPSVSGAYLSEGSPSFCLADLPGVAASAAVLADRIRLLNADQRDLARAGLVPTRGILLYGREGTGKLTLARAIAGSLDGRDGGPQRRPVRLLEVSYPHLLDKYVGEIERRLRLVFGRARELARRGEQVVLLFPRIDLLPVTWAAGGTQRKTHLGLPLIAAEMSRLRDEDGRVVIVATSRQRSIDSILLGPGKLAVQVEVPSPSRAEAREILSRRLFDGADHPVSLPPASQANLPLVEEVLCLIYDGPESDAISRAQLGDIAGRARASALARGVAGGDGFLREADLEAAVRVTLANAHADRGHDG